MTLLLQRMDVMKIPILIREQIFCMLDGGTLNTCRIVDKTWNKFLETLWHSNLGKEAFCFTLRDI